MIIDKAFFIHLSQILNFVYIKVYVLFQFNVIVTDTAGSPASCPVSINVVRDSAPTFSPTTYYKSILETEQVGGINPIITVSANDQDKKVCINYST